MRAISSPVERSPTRVGRRLAAYSAPVAVQLLTSALSLPILIGTIGPEPWSDLVVVQAVTAVSLVVLGFGWGTTGPTMIALADTSQRAEIYRDSLTVRVALFAVVGPLSWFAACWTTHLPVAATVLATAAYLMPGLGASWYFIGESAPQRLLLWDTMPRVIGTWVGLAATLISRDVTMFVALQAVFSVAGAIVSSIVILRGSTARPRFSWQRALATMRAQIPGVVTAGTTAMYTNIPLIIVALAEAQAKAPFALGYRLLKISLSAGAPLTQFLQGWIPRARADQVPDRVRAAARIAIGAGALGGIAFVLCVPWVGGAFALGHIHLPFAFSLPFGLAFGLIVASQTIGLACLTSLERARDLAGSTLAGAVLGTFAMLAASGAAGATGVVWAFVAAEATVLGVQIILLRRAVGARVIQSP